MSDSGLCARIISVQVIGSREQPHTKAMPATPRAAASILISTLPVSSPVSARRLSGQLEPERHGEHVQPRMRPDQAELVSPYRERVIPNLDLSGEVACIA